MIIYLYTNRINGKQYVGQTQRENDDRFFEHVRHHATAFDKAIDEYGIEAFDYRIIDHADSTEELNKKEQYWIKRLNTKIQNGYNLTDGGATTRGFHHSVESKKKMSATKRAEQYNVGKNNNFYGKHHTQETREKMKLAWTEERKKKQIPKLHAKHFKRAVINETTGKKFSSIKEAGAYYSILPTHITASLNGRQKTAGGFVWKYDDTEPSPNEGKV